MSHPDGLPDLFLDRSLGRKKVPELLRTEGLRVVTLAEHYGVPHDETIEDTEWLQLCGERGWLAVMAQRIIRALTDLAEICGQREGPFLFALQQNRLDEISLDQRPTYFERRIVRTLASGVDTGPTRAHYSWPGTRGSPRPVG